MADTEFTTEELMAEEWRPVVGWETHYAVSSLGRIKRTAPARGVTVGRILRPHPNKIDGYPCLSLWRGGRGKNVRVYRLVARAFLGPRPPGTEINHINGRKVDSRLVNLEYITHAENVQHGYDIGLHRPMRGDASVAHRFPHLMPRGSKHGMSRLTEDDIPAIRRRAAGGETQQSIAGSLHVDRATVGRVLRGKTWLHVP